jgi:hypothetical protein
VSVYWFRDASYLLGKVRDYSTVILNTIYLDIDDENKQTPSIWGVYRETSKLVRYLRDNNIIPRVYFSGRKGFHVYIDFPPVKLQYPKETIKMFVSRLEKQLKLQLIDSQCSGDIARVSRIPNTKHMNSGFYCVPFTIDEFLRFLNEGDILNIAKHPRFDFKLIKHPSKVVKKHLKKIDKEIENEAIKNILNDVSNKKKRKFKQHDKSIRPCIQRLINEAKTANFELDHQLRLAILFETLKKGWTEDQIVTIFSKQTDFDDNLTRYYINHAKESGYTPFKCKTLENDLKICFEECPIRKKRKMEVV